MKVVQHSNKLDIVMRASCEMFVFQLPGIYVFWGNKMLGLVHRVIVFASNGDVVFVSPKLKNLKSDQRFFRWIQKETDLQKRKQKMFRILVLIHLLSTLNLSTVDLCLYHQ